LIACALTISEGTNVFKQHFGRIKTIFAMIEEELK